MFSPNGIQAIFFDLDGTLRHSIPYGGDVFAEYATQIGMRISNEDRLRALRWECYYWANSIDLKADKEMYPEEDRAFWQHYCRRQLIALGASNSQADEFTPKVSRHMEDSYRPKSVIPEDVLQLLPQLRQAGYSMAIVSNREKSYQQEVEALGIASYFDFALAGGEVNSWKPDPDIFYHACKRAEVEPAQTMYVGDNYFADVIGSRRAGLQPVLYDPRGIFPDAECPVVTSFEQLPALLEKL